jgi:hypothetical protein
MQGGVDMRVSVVDMEYENPNIEILHAVKVQSWVFTLEVLTNNAHKILRPNVNDRTYMLAGFHGNSHYTFDPIDGEPSLNKLVDLVVGRFYPILEPILATSRCGEMIIE